MAERNECRVRWAGEKMNEVPARWTNYRPFAGTTRTLYTFAKGGWKKMVLVIFDNKSNYYPRAKGIRERSGSGACVCVRVAGTIIYQNRTAR